MDLDLIRTYKSIRKNLSDDVCCDTTLISSDGAKININFVIFHIRNSWLKTFYNDTENILLFPDITSEELTQFVAELYNFETSGSASDIVNKGNYDRDRCLVNEPVAGLAYARKSKPMEIEMVTEDIDVGHRDLGENYIHGTTEKPRLVFARKSTPMDIEMVTEVSEVGHRDLGENYILDTTVKPRQVYARKSKPMEMVNEISEGGHRDFEENYIHDTTEKPRLVYARKSKPMEMVTEDSEVGHRDLGENYIHDSTEKSSLVFATKSKALEMVTEVNNNNFYNLNGIKLHFSVAHLMVSVL